MKSSAESAGQPLDEFTLVLARSGRRIAVRAGESMLQALLGAHLDVSYSCEQGICGACELRFIDGEPVHRDQVRSAQEHTRLGTIMICCAGSRSASLTLDL